MAGRAAKLRFVNAPSVTLPNEYIITKTARYEADLYVPWANLTVGGASPTYLNYDWVLEDGATLLVGQTMAVTGDINFTAAQTFEKLCTFMEGLTVSTVGLTVTAGGIPVAAGNVVATTGAVQAGTTMTSAGAITSTLGNIRAAAGNISASAQVNGNSISAGTDLNITAGGITVGTGDATIYDTAEVVLGNITANGAGAAIEAGGTVTAGTGLTATTGGLTLDDGDLHVVGGHLNVPLGNVDVTLGSITGGTTITAGTGLAVIDPLAVTHAITGTAGAAMEWDGVTLTSGGFIRTLYTMNINEAAGASPADIATAALALNTYVTVDLLVNGLVIGEVANANIGDYYTARVFASFTNKAGVLAAEAMTTRAQVIHDGIGVGTKPVFISDINAANWRIQCTQGDDGAGKNNQILWRGEAKVTVTAI